MSESVKTGKCGPCCSSEPNGTTNIRCARPRRSAQRAFSSSILRFPHRPIGDREMRSLKTLLVLFLRLETAFENATGEQRSLDRIRRSSGHKHLFDLSDQAGRV